MTKTNLPKRRGIIIEKILEILQAQAESTAELIDIMTSEYSVSYRKLRQALHTGPRRFKTNWAEKYRETQRFYSLLNYLKRQGFIEQKVKNSSSFWKIRKAGLEKLQLMKKKRSLRSYESAPDDIVRVVIFDVPERERHKRIWLRSTLLSLGFSLLQKSVWIGKVKIPLEFLADLKDLKMLDYVHIFEINKKGTIHEA